MKKIFLATEQYQIDSDKEEYLPVVMKIFLFDLENGIAYFSFKIKNTIDNNMSMKKNYLPISYMHTSYEVENSFTIDTKKANKILNEKIKNLNGFFLHDFCQCYQLEELML